MKLIVLMCHIFLAWQWVSHLTVVIGAGMKLTVMMCLVILGLTVGKFCHGGWSWNEADCLDVLGNPWLDSG
jgi:hypothetical protein